MDRRTLLRHAITFALLGGGVVVLGLLARDIGLEPVRQHARALLWYVPAAVASFAIGHFANALGWWYAIGPDAPKVSKRRIFAAWSSGDVVNWMTPGAVGGEILRAHLIRDRVPMSVG